MGAKAPEKLKLRRPSCKCEVCGRKFLTNSALISHRKFVHKTNIVNTKRVPIKKTPNVDAAKPTFTNPPNSKKGAQVQVSKVSNKNVLIEIIEEDTAEKKVPPPKKFEFKCPKCVKVFNVYFSAYRHIQKNHCVDKQDRPIPPDSPKLIQPIRMELCETCNKFTPTSETHVCSETEEAKLEQCTCLSCQKTFESLVLFEHHVKGSHSSQADCLFFERKHDFTTFKTNLEATTKIKFVQKSLSGPKSKQVYHCTYPSPVDGGITLLCPSILSVSEINNGYQMIYYKEHSGHICADLPSEKYKKHSILPYLKGFEIQNIDGNEYQQFKSIMNNVTVSAAKVDMSVLYSLLEKALQMTVVLNDVYEEEQTVVNKSMNDAQISEALSIKTYPGKRKTDAKQKTETENETNKNSISDTIIINKVVKKLESEKLITSTLLKPVVQSPSFNDTYKDFVDQNFGLLDENTPKKNVANKRKVVVKTKIGQFKAKTSLSPKVDQDLSTSPDMSPKRTRLSVSPNITRAVVSPKPKPKPAMKKIGCQKLKPDFKYEVREQENDCNILVLKF